MRLFLNRRCIFSIILIISMIVYLSMNIKSSSLSLVKIRNDSNEIELILTKLFHSSTTLKELQYSWNQLIYIWKKLLRKFINDGCHLCHKNDIQCLNSIDIDEYIDNINEKFYPLNNDKRPFGMGLYYNFDLLLIRSMNNSILSNDKSICDYFHMFQLMIHVQIIFHENDIEYFMTKGTFIGSLRHHDIIPWDTDIDIFISYSSILKLINSIKQIKVNPNQNLMNINLTSNKTNSAIYRKDLVVYQFRNVHRVTSYKIFSINSCRVNQTYYNWPKIDVFPYYENGQHIFAHPRARHNLGTMNYFSKIDVYPIHLRPLGPLLVPSPQNLHQSLKTMIRLDQSNIFHVCQGNTFSHRKNQVLTEVWRVPCRVLTSSYPFVQSYRQSSNEICTEMLILNRTNKQIFSLYKYKCHEYLPRTLE